MSPARRRRRVWVLACLALLLALALVGIRVGSAAARRSVHERWDSGLRRQVLEQALAGVRGTFQDLADRARSSASDVAGVVSRLGLPSPRPDAEETEKLFTTVLEIELPPDISGILILDRDGRELAWQGRVRAPSRDLLDAVAAGKGFTGVLRSDLHRTIAAAAPIRSDGFQGAAVAFLPFDVTYPVHNRYLPTIRVEQDLARRWRVARVQITPPAETRPYESRTGDSIEASLALEDGRVVAATEIESDTVEGYLTGQVRLEAAWTAGLGLALTISLGAFLLVLLGRARRVPEAVHTVAAMAVLVLSRLGLRLLDFPGSLGPESWLDPTDFATTYLDGLLGNPGELLLTCATAAGVAALAVRLAVRTLHRRQTGRPIPLALRAIVPVAGLVAAAPLWTGYRFLVRSMVFDSTLDYVAPRTIWPEGPLLAMLLSLFLTTVTFLLLVTTLLIPVARVVRSRLPGRIVWLVIGVLVALFVWRTEEVQPDWLPPAVAALVGATGWLVESGRVRRFPAFVGLCVLPGTLLAFAVLTPVVGDEVRSDLRSEAREARRASIRDQKFTVERFLERAGKSPAIRSALRREMTDVPGLAFRLWAGSHLSARGIDCDVSILDGSGGEISRWEIRMPPRAWLPEPLPGRSVRRPLATPMKPAREPHGPSYIVGTGPVLDADGTFLGSILVRVPASPARRGGAPPEVLRNLAGEGGPRDRRAEAISIYRGDRLVDSTDPRLPRSRRAPARVVQALLRGDEDAAWVRETRDGVEWLDLYVPYFPPDDPEAEEGLLAASLPVPGILETLRSLLMLLIVGAGLGILLYAGHLVLHLRRIRLRFQQKLLASYLILSALPVGLLAHVNTDLAARQFRKSLEGRLRSSLGMLERELSRGGEQGFRDRMPDLFDRTDGIAPASSEWCKEESWKLNRDLNVYVVSRLRASSEPGVFRTELFPDRLSGRAFLEIVLRRRDFFAHRERAGDYAFLTGYAPLRDPQDGAVIGAVGVPMFWRQETLDRELAGRNTTLLAIYLLTLVLVVLIGILLSRRISSPIERLAEATARLGGGDLTYRIPRGSRDEFGELVDSFNRMAEDLAESRKRIVRAEKDAAWREMARQVAHEIKNPLTPMKLATQQILRAWEDRHPDMERILKRAGETIVRQVENLRRIASDFGDFARISVRTARPVPVNEVVREAIALYAGLSERRIVVESDLGEDLPDVQADAEDLKRVLINLLQNAVQAFEPDRGGHVRVSTRPTTVRFEGEDHPFVEIVVADDGPGVLPALRERIFEPNFSTKSGGTGLGLAICRQIVESLRGEIHVEGGAPSGAVFRVHLPASRVPSSHSGS